MRCVYAHLYFGVAVAEVRCTMSRVLITSRGEKTKAATAPAYPTRVSNDRRRRRTAAPDNGLRSFSNQSNLDT